MDVRIAVVAQWLFGGFVFVQGAEAAGDQMPTLDVFKSAKNIKVDPDKPLQQVRFRTLEVSRQLNISVRCCLRMLNDFRLINS